MSAKGAEQTQYCWLVRQHLKLAKEKADLETTLNEQELDQNKNYTHVKEQIDFVEARLDDITNGFENRDFQEFFQRVDG